MHRINIITNIGILATLVMLMDGAAFAAEVPPAESENTMPWWGWPILLFITTFVLGIVAVLGGVGGGVLFVPIVAGFFPFHFDFVRGAGLLVALAGALAAGPGLLRSGMANLRLAVPVSLVASVSAIAGAHIGLAMPQDMIQIAMGITILGIVVLMYFSKKSEYPEVPKADALSTALRINGIYHEPHMQKDINWHIHRTPYALVTFVGIGLMAGMFGLGAGWANVPVLNLLLGVPLKVSVATSKFMLGIVDTAAAWVYINQGAVLVMIVVPSIIGIMMGSMVGVRLLTRTNAAVIRKIVMGVLLVAGLRAVLKGLGI